MDYNQTTKWKTDTTWRSSAIRLEQASTGRELGYVEEICVQILALSGNLQYPSFAVTKAVKRSQANTCGEGAMPET